MYHEFSHGESNISEYKRIVKTFFYFFFILPRNYPTECNGLVQVPLDIALKNSELFPDHWGMPFFNHR